MRQNTHLTFTDKVKDDLKKEITTRHLLIDDNGTLPKRESDALKKEIEIRAAKLVKEWHKEATLVATSTDTNIMALEVHKSDEKYETSQIQCSTDAAIPNWIVY